MNYAAQEKRLRSEAKKLLESGEVELVLGFADNPEVGHPTPIFVRNVSDVEKLVWNEGCNINLAAYLRETKGKVAVAAKPADKRSVINLISEHQIDRDRVKIIELDYPVLERSPDEDNASARFLREIDKCILCFACRQACPGCYCTVCFIERKANPWEQIDPDRATKMAFHLTRAMHLAGRCTDCGACKKVCPSGVDIHYLYEGLTDFVEAEYGYKPGLDPDEPAVLAQYNKDDGQPGFLGGEDH